MKLRGLGYEFPWELTYRNQFGHMKEWKRFPTWNDAMAFMISRKIPN